MSESSKEKVEEIRERIIEQIAYNMRLYGMSETVGRLMATIYYNKKPMTLDEMSSELGMSKMSMSNAVRELIEMGVAEKLYRKESRKDLYVVEQDYYQFFIDLFCATWRKSVTTKRTTRIKINQELKDIMNDNNEDPEVVEEAQHLFEENKKALEYFDWLNRLIDHFETLEIFDSIPKTSSNKFS